MHGHLKSEVIIGTITLVSMDEEASKFGLRVSWTSTKIQSLFGTDFVSNNEVLRRTDLFDVSYIVRNRRLGLLGHVARLRSDVPANQMLQICTKTRDGERPSQEWRRAWPPRPTRSDATMERRLRPCRTNRLANDRDDGRLRLNASRHNDDETTIPVCYRKCRTSCHWNVVTKMTSDVNNI